MYHKSTITPFFNNDDHDDIEESGDVATVIKNRIKRPKLYKVLLHNDDYTTMEFVVYILKSFFGKNDNDAHKIMLQIHKEGVGTCGIYTYEIAETKSMQVTKSAEENSSPLKCTLEPE